MTRKRLANDSETAKNCSKTDPVQTGSNQALFYISSIMRSTEPNDRALYGPRAGSFERCVEHPPDPTRARARGRAFAACVYAVCLWRRRGGGFEFGVGRALAAGTAATGKSRPHSAASASSLPCALGRRSRGILSQARADGARGLCACENADSAYRGGERGRGEGRGWRGPV